MGTHRSHQGESGELQAGRPCHASGSEITSPDDVVTVMRTADRAGFATMHMR
jgi:hypothetical protein